MARPQTEIDSGLFDSLPESDRYDLPVPGTARGRKTRDRLLASAEEVFGEVGYDRASITAITQVAEVAQGTFYMYFPSKHAVFIELIKQLAIRMRQALAAAVNETAATPTATRAEIERGGMEAMFRFALDHPSFYRVIRESQFVAPEVYRWWSESFVAAYVANFARLTPNPPRSLDLESLGYAMIGLTDVFLLRWVEWEGRMPPPKVLDQLVDLLSVGLGGILAE